MKIKSLLLLAVMALVGFGASAQSTENDKLTIADFEIVKGEKAEIFFNLQNAVGIASLQGDIDFPEGITPVQYAEWDEDLEDYNYEWLKALGRAKNHSFAGNTPADADFRIVMSSMSNAKVNPRQEGNLNIASMMVEAAADATEGEFTGKISKIHFSTGEAGGVGDADGADTEFKVNIKNPGAVNDVNAAKAVAGVKYYNIAGAESATAFEGVNIMVTTYTDGSKSTVKVIK